MEDRLGIMRVHGKVEPGSGMARTVYDLRSRALVARPQPNRFELACSSVSVRRIVATLIPRPN